MELARGDCRLLAVNVTHIFVPVAGAPGTVAEPIGAMLPKGRSTGLLGWSATGINADCKPAKQNLRGNITALDVVADVGATLIWHIGIAAPGSRVATLPPIPRKGRVEVVRFPIDHADLTDDQIMVITFTGTALGRGVLPVTVDRTADAAYRWTIFSQWK